MRHDFKLERRLIIFGLVLLVAADVALAVYGWNLSAGRQPQEELAILTRNRDLLRADITRAQEIRKKIPAIKDDCDKFEDSLYPASKGYSSVSAELDSIAGKSGLSLESTGFREADVKGRELQQVEIEAVVTGSYSQVVHFLNGLQRSPNVYAVEALEARADSAQATNGRVRFSMHIKTYFRTT
ncbi:MAG TPA: type 4a pilus biogenesis protein PilO [Candidatus Eremiobacteraceae bacterium]|jgi:Tfp pilus assembly protein PilO|nr:type 4a pilus biogenesis protein PilO [Candidatus Eremiobacteraceae bacterium]